MPATALAQNAEPLTVQSGATTQEAEAERAAEEELREITTAISISEDRVQTLRAEIERLSGDRAEQNAALIAAAQRIKLAELEVVDAEQRLTGLLAQERQIRLRLDGEDIQIASLLAAVQRIGKNPPPALIIDPTDAINAARSASLLSAVLPQLRARADAVTQDLMALVEVREGVEAEKSILNSRLGSLQEEQLRIAALIEAKRVGANKSAEELAAEEETAAQLASQATSLNQLVEALRNRIEAVDEAVNAAENINAQATDAPLTEEQIRVALANTARSEPAFPISAADGFLTPPASGVPIIEFGADDGFGGVSKGIYTVTRAEAQIVAPSDGWVIYKGPYLNYGEIIIINPGDDHTILLAGLDQTSVELGQFVLQGEPVGTMGSRTFGQTLATSAGVSRPTLYIEFRKANLAFDPSPLWAKTRIAQTPG